MTKRVSKVIDQVYKEICPEKKEVQELNKQLKEFLFEINSIIKKLKIKAEPFVGGSFAKNTFVKSSFYEVDLFIRFDSIYNEKQISENLKKILKKYKKQASIHGSRDYYQILLSNKLYAEIVPVVKVQKPELAKNTTDLSYFHVKYVKSKIKSPELQKQILIAKTFAKACNCYGAESYINGFSGYSLELLIIKYKTFENFLNQILKTKIPTKAYKNLWSSNYDQKAKELNEKIIIDLEKYYKNENHLLMDLNESKTHSPIILIDPTFKERNALAALNKESFLKFKKHSQEFLKNPDESFFKKKLINLNEIQKNALKNKLEFKRILIKTNKQSGDIAGTKLLKFYNFLLHQLERFFEIKNSGFEYNKFQEAEIFLVLKQKKEIIFSGPLKNQKISLQKFKETHKKIFFKNNRAYAKKELKLNFSSFIKRYLSKRQLKDMSIINLKELN